MRGSGANLPEGVVSALEGLWDMSRTPTCTGARFQYPDFQGIERSTCPTWPFFVQVDYFRVSLDQNPDLPIPVVSANACYRDLR